MLKRLADKDGSPVNRRRFIAATGMAVAGSALAGSVAMADIGKSKQSSVTAPTLPWPWKKLDPMEAGRRAFNYYHEKGG
ncbi:MAG: hypothetical protein AB7F20_01635 [Geoalkalibacter sp.]|jgi:hypothetical protein|uniref:hypothetical protein n=1 Tax=Geoalkalibacter sp. TaxID=3041440 RepID=UPI002A963AB9|nr:hypothetical protein [Thermodesulfobacteriota bacterium]